MGCASSKPGGVTELEADADMYQGSARNSSFVEEIRRSRALSVDTSSSGSSSSLQRVNQPDSGTARQQFPPPDVDVRQPRGSTGGSPPQPSQEPNGWTLPRTPESAAWAAPPAAEAPSYTPPELQLGDGEAAEAEKPRRRRLTAANQTDAFPQEPEFDVGPKPYTRVASSLSHAPLPRQHIQDKPVAASSVTAHPLPDDPEQRSSGESLGRQRSDELQWRPPGEAFDSSAQLPNGCDKPSGHRLTSGPTSSAGFTHQPDAFGVADAAASAALPPPLRVRRLMSQSVELPRSRADEFFGAQPDAVAASAAFASGSWRADGEAAAQRQSMPGDAGGPRLMRHVRFPGAPGAGDTSIATRSVDASAATGSVFSQQLAAVRAAAAARNGGGRPPGQQPLRRHATTAGQFAAGLVPPAAHQADHRRSEGSLPWHGRPVTAEAPAEDEDQAAAAICFSDLEGYQVVGTGQFGSVRLVRHTPSGVLYALKVLHKAPIVEAKQVEHVVNERRAQEAAAHPLCVRLHAAFQDARCLYLLQEFVPGGELLTRLEIEGQLPDDTARFYTACVVAALASLHAKGFVYRDLKPENLLVDAAGYVKVADFGFAKHIGSERTYTICGTPDYQAPEVIQRKGTSFDADWWGVGVLLYELLTGEPPFKSASGDPWDTFRRVLAASYELPDTISPNAADLIARLLQVNVAKRLGCGEGGAQAVREHPYFQGLDWAALEARALRSPAVPPPADPLRAAAFPEPPPPPAFPGNQKDPNAGAWAGLWDWVDAPLRQSPPPPAGGVPAAQLQPHEMMPPPQQQLQQLAPQEQQHQQQLAEAASPARQREEVLPPQPDAAAQAAPPAMLPAVEGKPPRRRLLPRLGGRDSNSGAGSDASSIDRSSSLDSGAMLAAAAASAAGRQTPPAEQEAAPPPAADAAPLRASRHRLFRKQKTSSAAATQEAAAELAPPPESDAAPLQGTRNRLFRKHKTATADPMQAATAETSPSPEQAAMPPGSSPLQTPRQGMFRTQKAGMPDAMQAATAEVTPPDAAGALPARASRHGLFRKKHAKAGTREIPPAEVPALRESADGSQQPQPQQPPPQPAYFLPQELPALPASQLAATADASANGHLQWQEAAPAPAAAPVPAPAPSMASARRSLRSGSDSPAASAGGSPASTPRAGRRASIDAQLSGEVRLSSEQPVRGGGSSARGSPQGSPRAADAQIQDTREALLRQALQQQALREADAGAAAGPQAAALDEAAGRPAPAGARRSWPAVDEAAVLAAATSADSAPARRWARARGDSSASEFGAAAAESGPAQPPPLELFLDQPVTAVDGFTELPSLELSASPTLPRLRPPALHLPGQQPGSPAGLPPLEVSASPTLPPEIEEALAAEALPQGMLSLRESLQSGRSRLRASSTGDPGIPSDAQAAFKRSLAAATGVSQPQLPSPAARQAAPVSADSPATAAVSAEAAWTAASVASSPQGSSLRSPSAPSPARPAASAMPSPARSPASTPGVSPAAQSDAVTPERSMSPASDTATPASSHSSPRRSSPASHVPAAALPATSSPVGRVASAASSSAGASDGASPRAALLSPPERLSAVNMLRASAQRLSAAADLTSRSTTVVNGRRSLDTGASARTHGGAEAADDELPRLVLHPLQLPGQGAEPQSPGRHENGSFIASYGGRSATGTPRLATPRSPDGASSLAHRENAGDSPAKGPGKRQLSLHRGAPLL